MALIVTIEELKNYVSVDQSTDMTSLLPDLDWAEETFIEKYLGFEQYQALVEAYEAGILDTGKKLKQLLTKVQRALANLAYAKYLPINQLSLSDQGVRIRVDSTNKTAFQWQINGVNNYLLEKGYDGLEKLLEFLEQNKADFPAWATSPAYTVFKEYLINSATEFDKWYNIRNSRRTFLALLPVLRRVESKSVAQVISMPLLERVKAEISSGSISKDIQVLLLLLQPAVAYLVMAEAIPELPLDISAGGVVINELMDMEGSKRLAKDSLLSFRMESDRANGQFYLKTVKDYLNANASATKYPEYFNSELYSNPASNTASAQTGKIYGLF